MVTPRRRGGPPPPMLSELPQAPVLTPPERQMIKGDKGDPGSPGPRGPSVFLGVSESGSTELYGFHPQGFALIASEGAPIQGSFSDWQPGDVLEVSFWVQLSVAPPRPIIIQAQLSTNGGSVWHAVSGARLALSPGSLSASASSSVEVTLSDGAAPPLVRLHVTQLDANGPDYGPGPEGSTLLLRSTRWAAGTYSATGKLTPPRT